MHCLEVIIARNAQAAGREAGHADTDGDDRLASAIHDAAVENDEIKGMNFTHDNEIVIDFVTGYLRGRKEG